MRNFKAIIDTRDFGVTSALILIFMAAVLLITVFVYFPGLPGPLLTDDVPQLKGLIDHSGDALGQLIDIHLMSNSGPFGRPVAMATFIGDAISHGPDIWWWKFNNVMYHLIAGLLVFWLTALLVLETTDSRPNRAWLMAAVVAAFWLLHPLHISTVFYTVQRMTELSTLFVLAGLVSYVKGRRAQEYSVVKGWLLITLGFGVFFPLALLSKENALLFPVYCTLIELIVFQFKGSAAVKKQTRLFQGFLILGYVSAAVYILVNFSSRFMAGYAARDFTLLERVLTEARVLVLYIAQLLRPIQSEMGFFHDDLVLSTGLFAPITTLLSIVFLLALIGSAIFLWKRLPLYAFGILFFFAAHALESSVFSLELMFEHRNHLASFGIILALVAVGSVVIKAQRAKILIVVLGLCGLSFLTYQRATTWSSAPTMYDFMYYAHPTSPRLSYIFADVYSGIEDYERARQALANVTPGLGTGVYELYLDCLEFKQVGPTAVSDLVQISGGKLNGHVVANMKLLAEAVLDRRCPVPKQSIVPLIDHVLTLPYRTDIDQQVLRNFRKRLL
jgi:hypothetical protein